MAESESLETRVALIENKLKEIPPREWVKDFVREFVSPLQESIARIDAAVTSLAQEAKSLFTAHSEMLREKAAQDKRALEDRTAFGLVKKWAPVISLASGCFLVYEALSHLLASWLKTHGF